MRDLEVREPGLGVEVHGPFMPEHRVTNGGFHVPYLTIHPQSDGTFAPVIDNRFGTYRSVTQEELDLWIPLLANAMAVAAGYSCHGENCTPLNPHKVRMSRLGALPPDLTVVPGGKSGDPV